MKRPPLAWDAAWKHHAKLLERLARCEECLVRVPLPTTNGRCLYCFRDGSKKGALPPDPWPLSQPDPVPVPE